MPKNQCPECGGETNAEMACSACGYMPNVRHEVPAEVATWNIERPTSDILAWARQTFNKEEYLAGLREIEQGGGHRFEDFIGEIEHIANGRRI